MPSQKTIPKILGNAEMLEMASLHGEMESLGQVDYPEVMRDGISWD
jgi:hypothetical protein